MDGPERILLVEDSETDAKLIIRELGKLTSRLVTARVEDAEAMRAALAQGTWDVVLSDWSLPKFSALAALRVLRDSGKDLPFIIVSGTIGEEAAVEAMRAGAHDYVLKDRLGRLIPAARREFQQAQSRDEKRRAEQALNESQSDRLRLEAQLRQAQKMEAIGSLAGGVAHDFNNLLSVILSYSDLLITDLDPASPMRADLLEIRAAGRRASELTRQLLAFSRKQTLEPKIIDLNDVAHGMTKMLQRLIGEHVELTLRTPTGQAKVYADPGQIEQVIMNLAVNARDAMPTGGKLDIDISQVILDDDYAAEHVGVTPGVYILLAISDTGTGIPPEIQTRIFDPFFTTKEQGKGTGLGLSTVFGIVKQSQGNVSVYSEVGIGTTFKVFLPQSDPAAPLGPVGKSTTAAKVGGRETILLVEDDVGVRPLARSILLRQGYNVIEAQNGREALARCEHYEGQIHLLLTDVVMPRMSGVELAKRLLAMRPAMRVLYMSGYADHTVMERGMLQPHVAFIQKPITPETLGSKIRSVLDAEGSS